MFWDRNVMIADDGKTPILMDFGSTMMARVHIENRSQALLQQVRISCHDNSSSRADKKPMKDIAAEQSTMAYRAPELFDVKTGQTIDEKVDIWVRRCLFPPLYSSFLIIFLVTLSVIGMHTIRTRVLPLAI